MVLLKAEVTRTKSCGPPQATCGRSSIKSPQHSRHPAALLAAVAVFTYAAFAACFLVAAAARFAAYRFLSAATIAARPAGDSLRFGF